MVAQPTAIPARRTTAAEPPINRQPPGFGPVVERVRLVLCMIVRNESAVIQRCLESVLPHVDGFVVCDTGSTDDTVRIVGQTAQRYGRPGRVAEHQWRNFGENRTRSAEEARAWVEAQGWPTRSTYLLHLDADMVLHVDPAFDRQLLSATSYDVVQDNGGLRYWNVRLTRLSHEWSAVGATHEYWEATPGGATSARLDSMSIEDLCDGGSRTDKSERDLDLLRAELEVDPGNPRHTFYLAQTLYDMGRWQEAADWYARRRNLGGWEEERWYARYREGLSLLCLGEEARGIAALLDAFEERPSRAEPLWDLARHCRETGKHQLALLFAQGGLELTLPDRDALFLEPQVYDWRLWEEVMISAWYAGPEHRALGLRACEVLRAQRDHEPAFYPYVAANEVFYLPVVEADRRGTFLVPDACREHDGVVFQTANPTIARWRGELRVNVRLLNYRIDSGGEYRCLSPDGIFRSHNAPLPWTIDDIDAEPIAVLREMPSDWPSDTWSRGLDDVRFTVHQDRIWFTATCYQVPGADGAPRVVLGRLNERLDAVEHLVPLSYPEALPAEKNWLPWSVAGELRLIYSFDPLLVLLVDPPSGRATALGSTDPPVRAADWRGACPPIPFPDGTPRWLAVIHEVAARPAGRVYWHRWVEIDEAVGITRYSSPFVFDHAGIEYAAGLAALDEHRVVVTYGHEDREARWIECRWDRITASLDSGPVHVENERPSPSGS